MQAQSFVGGVRMIDHRAQSLLEEPRLERDLSRQHGLATLASLSTLSALIRDGAPLSVPENGSAGRPLVETLLDRLYADGALEVRSLDRNLRDRVAESKRVVIVGPAVVIPLATGDTEHNWRPVFRLLLDRLAEVASKVDRIVSRLGEQVGTRRVWETVVETVRDLRELLKKQLAQQERLHRLYTRPSDAPAEFAGWTLKQLSETRPEL